jgi:hypothetical protein
MARLQLSFQAFSPACFPSATLGTALDLRSKTSRGERFAGIVALALRIQTLQPACFPSATLGTALDLRSKTSREWTALT